MPFVDFADVKARISMERAISILGLKMTPNGVQYRGPCPACKDGGDRALVVTMGKELFFCFAAKKGGDVIAFAAHVLGCKLNEAAERLSPETRTSAGTSTSRVQVPTATVPPKEKGALKPLDYLQAEHELVQGMGLSAETCSEWGAGYAPKGIMRGRLAIPIHDAQGTLLAYCGRAVKGESPELIFPNGFNPEGIIFGAHRVEEGFLYVVKDPLDVLRSYEGGITNVVAWLTAITPQWLDTLSSLMDERKVETMEFFTH